MGPGFDALAKPLPGFTPIDASFIWTWEIRLGNDARQNPRGDSVVKLGVNQDGHVYLILESVAMRAARSYVRLDSAAMAELVVAGTRAALEAEEQAGLADLKMVETRLLLAGHYAAACPEALPSLEDGGAPVQCTVADPDHSADDVHSAPGVRWLNNDQRADEG